MHMRHIWVTIILSLCMVPAFGQGKMIIKGLEQAKNIPALTERVAYLRHLNPTVSVSVLESAARKLSAAPTATLSTPPQQRFMQLPQRPRTGMEIYEHFGLREKLFATALFSDSELNSVELAIKNTDAVFYRQTGEDVSLLTQGWEAVEEPWNYMNRLLTELTFTFPQMSDSQRFVIRGGNIHGFTLRAYGQLLSLQNCLLYAGKLYPAKKHPLYLAVQARKKSGKADPLSLEMYALLEQYQTRKTPQTWLEEYENHPEQFTRGTTMYTAFAKKYRQTQAALAAGQEVDEFSLRMAQIYQENTGRKKTPQEWLEEYEQHPEQLTQGTAMYTAFSGKTYQVEAALAEGKEVDEFSLKMAQIYREETKTKKTSQEWLKEYEEHPEQLVHGTALYEAFQRRFQYAKSAQAAGKEVDPFILQIATIYSEYTREIKTQQEWLEEYEQHPELFIYKTPMYRAFQNRAYHVKAALAAGQEVDEFSLKMADIYWENTTRPATTQEAYNTFLTYLQENHSYPPARSAEYKRVYVRLYGKSLADIKADPDLYKLYRLDQLARAVRRGEKPWEVFDRANPLRRERIAKTNEQEPEQLSAEELEESYTQLSADEQQILRQTEEYYDQLWQHYPQWFEENQENIVFTPQTVAAFETLNRQVASGRTNEGVTATLDMLQQLPLGSAQAGVFNRVIYRGNNATLIPRAEDFHLVAEVQGLPQLPHVREMFPQEVPHIYFKFTDGKMTTLGLTPGATASEVETAVDTLLSHLSEKSHVSNATDGWKIRLGKHEMSNRPHIHFEFVDSEEGIDLSHVLRLDVREVIPEEPTLRQQAFDRLFGKYIER